MNEAMVADQAGQLQQLAPYIMGLVVIPALGLLKKIPWVKANLDYNHLAAIVAFAFLGLLSLAMGAGLSALELIEMSVTAVGAGGVGYGFKKLKQKQLGENRPGRRFFTEGG